MGEGFMLCKGGCSGQVQAAGKAQRPKMHVRVAQAAWSSR